MGFYRKLCNRAIVRLKLAVWKALDCLISRSWFTTQNFLVFPVAPVSHQRPTLAGLSAMRRIVMFCEIKINGFFIRIRFLIHTARRIGNWPLVEWHDSGLVNTVVGI